MPTFEEKDRAQGAAAEDSFSVYDWAILVTLEWVTIAELEEELQYLNSRGTRAMLEGVVFSDHPDHYTSPYGGPDAPPPRYDWKPYQADLRNARRDLDRMRALLPRYGEVADEPVIRLPRDSADCRRSDEQQLVRRAANAMEHALRTAIWATGEVPGTSTPCWSWRMSWRGWPPARTCPAYTSQTTEGGPASAG